MKTYKQNITIPFLTFITYIFIFLVPFLMILWMIINVDKPVDAILSIPYSLLLIFAIYLIEEIVNLFGKISKKHIVSLSNDKIFYDNKEIKYEFVDKIVFEKGLLNKFNKGMSSALILFNGEKVLMDIKNPSFPVIFNIYKRCKNNKKPLINKKFLLICGIIYLLTLISWLILVLVKL